MAKIFPIRKCLHFNVTATFEAGHEPSRESCGSLALHRKALGGCTGWENGGNGKKAGERTGSKTQGMRGEAAPRGEKQT